MGLTGQSTDPDGFVVSADRDTNGLATVTIDRLNRIERISFDTSGRPTSVKHQDTTLAQYSYNGFSELTELRRRERQPHHLQLRRQRQ